MGIHPVTLSREQARRIAVRAQLLTAERPAGLLPLVAHLGSLQIEHTAYVAPTAHVVAWSRLGSGYRPEDLDDAVADGDLVEILMRLIPAADVAAYRAEMANWPGDEPLREWQEDGVEWLAANDECRREILARLQLDGPSPAASFPDLTVVPWRSSGWTGDRNVQAVLSMMVRRGEVAVAGREGQDVLYDLAERVYPDDPLPPLEESRPRRAATFLRAMGIARTGGQQDPREPLTIADAGVPARIEDVRGPWRVDPAYLDDDEFEPRAALLSPLDRLVFDRKRAAEIFEYDYKLEMYTPKAKRQWGYWAMPVLFGDQLIGKLDAQTDRDAARLRVHALHWDVQPSRAMMDAVQHEIDDLATWLGVRRSDG